MKDWEVYESQIFEKLKEEFPNADILKNQKIKGLFSKAIRQVDILVSGNIIGKNFVIVIDCKKFNRKIDVKAVESFIGFIEDTKANMGIMITNNGYTKAAERRVLNYPTDIRLDIVEYSKLDDYHFEWDSCPACSESQHIQREILWGNPLGLQTNGKLTIVQQGQCNYCGEGYIKCQACGIIIDINEYDSSECYCGTKFIFESEYVGQGMYEKQISIRTKNETVNLVDLNQLNLFD